MNRLCYTRAGCGDDNGVRVCDEVSKDGRFRRKISNAQVSL